jgi:ribosomal protein S25
MMQLGVSKATVYCVIKAGRVERKKRETAHNKKLTEIFLEKLAKTVEASPTVSIRKTAKKLKICNGTIRNRLKKLGKKSLVRPPAPLLSERLQMLRLERSKKLLAKLKHLPESTVRSSLTRRCSRSTRSTTAEMIGLSSTRVPQLPQSTGQNIRPGS